MSGFHEFRPCAFRSRTGAILRFLAAAGFRRTERMIGVAEDFDNQIPSFLSSTNIALIADFRRRKSTHIFSIRCRLSGSQIRYGNS